jgi:hypothetical protein
MKQIRKGWRSACICEHNVRTARSCAKMLSATTSSCFCRFAACDMVKCESRNVFGCRKFVGSQLRHGIKSSTKSQPLRHGGLTRCLPLLQPLRVPLSLVQANVFLLLWCGRYTCPYICRISTPTTSLLQRLYLRSVASEGWVATHRWFGDVVAQP